RDELVTGVQTCALPISVAACEHDAPQAVGLAQQADRAAQNIAVLERGLEGRNQGITNRDEGRLAGGPRHQVLIEVLPEALRVLGDRKSVVEGEGGGRGG